MQRLAYVIVSTVLVACMTLSFGINKDSSEGKQESTSSSEEAIDTDSQVIEESSQETVQEEIIVSEPEISSSLSTPSVQERPTPQASGEFKSYTNYKLLNHNSPQWTKIQCNENAYTDENGLRKVGEYYCVAMGSYYAKALGDLFEIQTEGGSFKVIICDFKSDIHTDRNNQYTLSNGCVVEFYVDTSILSTSAQRQGNISCVNENFLGKIVEINSLGNYFGE